MRFYAFDSAAKPGAGNSSKIVNHWAVQGGAHNRLYIDKVQPCEGFERAIDCIQDTRFSPLPVIVAAAARYGLTGSLHRTLLHAISIPIRRECRICMQRQLTFGGGVSPRGTRLRGQSIIEYVLIAAVIGLVVVYAGGAGLGSHPKPVQPGGEHGRFRHQRR